MLLYGTKKKGCNVNIITMYRLNNFMHHIFQIIIGKITIELGLYWGMLLGFRTFEPD